MLERGQDYCEKEDRVSVGKRTDCLLEGGLGCAAA